MLYVKYHEYWTADNLQSQWRSAWVDGKIALLRMLETDHPDLLETLDGLLSVPALWYDGMPLPRYLAQVRQGRFGTVRAHEFFPDCLPTVSI